MFRVNTEYIELFRSNKQYPNQTDDNGLVPFVPMMFYFYSGTLEAFCSLQNLVSSGCYL